MKRYIIMRILKAIFTIWAVYTLVFFLTRVTGDPVDWLTQAGASDTAKETLRANLGLDLPLSEQYVKSSIRSICRANLADSDPGWDRFTYYDPDRTSSRCCSCCKA